MPKVLKHTLIKFMQSIIELLFLFPIIILVSSACFSDRQMIIVFCALPAFYLTGIVTCNIIKNKSNFFYIIIGLTVGILFSVSIFGFSNPFLIFYFSIITAFSVFRGVRIYNSSWLSQSPIPSFTPLFAIYFIMYFVFLVINQLQPYLKLFNICTILMVFVFLLICSFDQLKLAFYKNGGKNFIPSALLRFNIIAMLLIFLLIIFVARFKPLWNIILFAVKMILYAVYSFYSHLFIGSGGSSKVENNDIRLFPKPEYNISYLETLGKLVNIIIIALFSVLTLYLIFKLTMAILKWFYSKSEARKSQDSKLGYTDEKEVILKSHSGFLANMKKRLSNFDYKEVHLNDLKTSRDKVRFIYRQKIMSFIKKGYVFKGYLSPNEHANELNAKYDENISDLTSLYNKARYSNDDIEDKDIEALNLNKTRQNI